MTALSINLNKVATLRNTRHLGEPSVLKAALAVLRAGAQGITVHPRPDERHIRGADVGELAAMLKDWPHVEYNIEGNPFHNLMDHIRAVRPHQATFVPDSEGQFTSDHGWNVPEHAARLRELIAECHALGVRVSLFMDPEPPAMAAARQVGADRIELYTETYASTFGTARQTAVTAQFAAAAQAAADAGLGVNAGHDLNLQNLSQFVASVPRLQEVSIGHAFMGDALHLGFTEATAAYRNAIAAGLRQRASKG